MQNPIASVITADKIELYGILLKTDKKDGIIINIHGTADNFYDNTFIRDIAKSVSSLHLSMLSTNNRGSHGLDVYQPTGATVEIFEKCILDIDAWIAFALKLGYKKIILQGHSLGTEKVVYYMNKGKYRNKVTAVILLGFSDSFGTQEQYLKKIKLDLMSEAKTLVKQKKGQQFLTKKRLCHANVLPQSATSYINFFAPQSELSLALPLRQGKNLKMYQNIKVPILGVIGDQEEYTILPISQIIGVLKKENNWAKIYQIPNCDHNFTSKGTELAKIVKKFLNNL